MDIAAISHIHVLDSPWHTASHLHSQSRIDEVDLEL
jgi:hypothetical protein